MRTENTFEIEDLLRILQPDALFLGFDSVEALLIAGGRVFLDDIKRPYPAQPIGDDFDWWTLESPNNKHIHSKCRKIPNWEGEKIHLTFEYTSEDEEDGIYTLQLNLA